MIIDFRRAFFKGEWPKQVHLLVTEAQNGLILKASKKSGPSQGLIKRKKHFTINTTTAVIFSRRAAQLLLYGITYGTKYGTLRKD